TKKNNYPDAKPNPTVLKMVETILESRDYSKNKYVSQYNFTDLYITMKDGKIGMVNENGEVFIEHEYDEIEFSHYDYAVTLHKNGKVGIKQILRETGNLFLLEPKYDDIKLAQTILFDRTPFGKDKRTFMVFEVELNGVKGYVGENGVEYFNFE
ncbi:MAG: WG repeat-containing protein, partial [Bacteroidota bacterium]